MPIQDIMPDAAYWTHTGLLFLLLFFVEYVNGLAVKYRNVRVNYTRKINHFVLFFSPLLLMDFFPYDRTGLTFFWGSLLTLLSLLIFSYPVRRRVSVLATMFMSFDRPEDRPNTLLWLTTQFLGSYLVLAAVAYHLAGHDAEALLYIPILINGIGDGLAEPVGVRFGRHRYRTSALFSRKRYHRSLEGSACVLITGVLVIYFGDYPFNELQFAVAIVAIPIVMTLAEAFSPHTWDSPFLYGVGGAALLGIINLV
ncbi:MAG: hypothetical protein ACU833_11525 [Gammaproteobacteria bacterium]